MLDGNFQNIARVPAHLPVELRHASPSTAAPPVRALEEFLCTVPAPPENSLGSAKSGAKNPQIVSPLVSPVRPPASRHFTPLSLVPDGAPRRWGTPGRARGPPSATGRNASSAPGGGAGGVSRGRRGASKDAHLPTLQTAGHISTPLCRLGALTAPIEVQQVPPRLSQKHPTRNSLRNGSGARSTASGSG